MAPDRELVGVALISEALSMVALDLELYGRRMVDQLEFPLPERLLCCGAAAVTCLIRLQENNPNMLGEAAKASVTMLSLLECQGVPLMRVGSAFRVLVSVRARLRSWVLAVVIAPWALGSLGGCASSPESMAEYRGYEYQYELAERYRLGDGVRTIRPKPPTGTTRPLPVRPMPQPRSDIMALV